MSRRPLIDINLADLALDRLNVEERCRAAEDWLKCIAAPISLFMSFCCCTPAFGLTPLQRKNLTDLRDDLDQLADEWGNDPDTDYKIKLKHLFNNHATKILHFRHHKTLEQFDKAHTLNSSFSLPQQVRLDHFERRLATERCIKVPRAARCCVATTGTLAAATVVLTVIVNYLNNTTPAPTGPEIYFFSHMAGTQPCTNKLTPDDCALEIVNCQTPTNKTITVPKGNVVSIENDPLNRNLFDSRQTLSASLAGVCDTTTDIPPLHNASQCNVTMQCSYANPQGIPSPRLIVTKTISVTLQPTHGDNTTENTPSLRRRM